MTVLRTPRDLPCVPVGRGAATVEDLLRGRVDLLSAREAAALSTAPAWGTIDELSAGVARAGVMTRAEATAVLRGLAERGVLPSEAELVARMTADLGARGATSGDRARAEPDGQGPKVATLGIPTRGRPEALRRALATFGRDLAESGRGVDVLVAGGATDGSGEHSVAVAREAEARWGVRVRCAGVEDARRFAFAVAAEAGVPPEVALRALVPEDGATFAAGTGRNLLLLDAAGRCSLQVDDDTICDLRAAPPGAGDLLALRSFEDPAEMWFGEAAAGPPGGGAVHASRGAQSTPGAGREELDEAPMDASREGAWRDHTAIHERLLGRSAGALVAAAAAEGKLELRRASARLFERIAGGAGVVCTQLGVRGDPAIGAMGWLLTLPEPSRGRLLASERLYREVITSRRLARAVTDPTLTELERCMTVTIGLDGRDVLPPFPPLYRNEDGLFGAALAVCRPGAVLGHLPFTVAHEPVDARAAPFDAVFEQAGRLGMNDVIAGLAAASRREVDTGSAGAAVSTLGDSLSKWGRLPARELFERLWWMLAESLARRLARIEALLREARGAPSFWAADLERLADVIRERAEDPGRAVPLEHGDRRALDAGRELARRRITEYGQLLACWPAMWDAARRLRESGRSPLSRGAR